MKKGDMLKEFKISRTKFNAVFNKKVIEDIIGLDYMEYRKMRVLPDFISNKMRLYWSEGDVYIPEEGIYILRSDNKKWALSDIDLDTRTVKMTQLDKYGMLGDVEVDNLPFTIVRTAYKKEAI